MTRNNWETSVERGQKGRTSGKREKKSEVFGVTVEGE